MYVYDEECSLADSEFLSVDGKTRDGEKLGPHDVAWFWRRALKEAGLLAETYESACMFIHVSWVGVKPCAAEAPLWNGGANHVMVDFSDKGRDFRPGVVDSFAMEAASNMHTCFYRTGYDIAMPLAPKKVFHDLSGIAPLEREYFLTFKGSLYLNSHGSEERVSLRPLHDEDNGVITALGCFEVHKEHLMEENVEYCEGLKSRFEKFDYNRLMNTTFGLVPGGRSPGTYRLAEVMSAGAIPVFVARDIIQPFREQFDWPSFSFSFAPTDVWSSLMKTLRAVPPDQLAEMQRKSLEAYWEIFGGETQDFAPIARRMVEVVQQRVGHRG